MDPQQLLKRSFLFRAMEWWSYNRLRDYQFSKLGKLVQFSSNHCPYYRRRIADERLTPKGPWVEETFRRLPLLTRKELIQEVASICADVDPEGPTYTSQTSGSTGQVVSVKKSEENHLNWLALNLRDHDWYKRDPKQTLVSIKAHLPRVVDDLQASSNGWGYPANLVTRTGPGYSLPLSTDVSEQVDLILRVNPGYLLTYPTNLSSLLDRFEALGKNPDRLLEVRTLGETVTEELRSRCRQVLGVPLVDVYSSQEVGSIALQCPKSGLYHIHSESLLVEVLDPIGRQCSPGETGRVVITDLFSYAMPIIRYEIGDMAEVGPACECGRSLPTLSRILGRTRNMVRLPLGRMHWPIVGHHHFHEVGKVLQYQLVQHSLEEIEARLVVEGGAFDTSQEERLANIMRQALGHPFPIRFTYFDGELPNTRSGKFEEFVCLM